MAVEPARRLETQRNLFVVMRLGSPVVLSYFDAGFEPRCGLKDFLTACCLLLLLLAACCLLLLKRVAHPWPLKGGVKPRQGKPSLVITDGHDDCPQKRLNNGTFSPQNGPPCGTTA